MRLCWESQDRGPKNPIYYLHNTSKDFKLNCSDNCDYLELIPDLLKGTGRQNLDYSTGAFFSTTFKRYNLIFRVRLYFTQHHKKQLINWLFSEVSLYKWPSLHLEKNVKMKWRKKPKYTFYKFITWQFYPDWGNKGP